MSIFQGFMLDIAAKALHSGLLAIAAKGYINGDQVTTLQAGGGVLATLLVTSALKSWAATMNHNHP